MKSGIYKNQTGAALVVSLMLVAVASLLALTSMQTTVVDRVLIENDGFRQTTFHAAEAAADQAIDTLDPATLLPGDPLELQATSIDDRINVTVTARQEGMMPLVNTSLKLFGVSVYAVEAVASNNDISSRRTVVAGASQRIPLSR